MSLAKSVSRDDEPAEKVGEVDFQNRKIATYLMYAAAIFCVVSIFIEGWLTSQWDLNLGFVIFWLCGHFLLTGSRGAVKWSIRLTVVILVTGLVGLITALFAPYRIEFKEYAITPLIAQLAMYLTLAITIWAGATLIPLFNIRRSEQLQPDGCLNLKTLSVLVVIPTLIFSIIGGLMYLKSPYVDLADEVPVTNSQSEQIQLLQSRYGQQIEYLKSMAVDPDHNVNNREKRELQRELFWHDSGIIEASYQALNDDGITLSTNTLHHSSYRSSIEVTVPGFHNTGTVTLDDDKRYSVLYYRVHLQDDRGIWLGIELVVRQDHLQAKDIRGKVNNPKLE